jgi:SAM-dependent methyltransferase
MLLFTHWFIAWLGSAMALTATSTTTTAAKKNQSFDSRTTLSRSEARQVYDRFAEEGHATGGKDADSGYGGPAVAALLEIADFESAKTVLDYGCGQGKLAELVLKKKFASLHNQTTTTTATPLQWRGIDQSPQMVERFRESCCDDDTFGTSCTVELLESGDPNDVSFERHSVDRFVSTYCLDLLSEEDMYKVLDLAHNSLHPERGLLLLAGITWGYKSKSSSIQTFVMTAVWDILYQIRRKKVGGCRPQHLVPYLEARGWRIEKVVQTMPNGFPWMVSEVVSARPPLSFVHKQSID